MDSPAVYVPTPINASVASTSAKKQEDQATRSYGAGIRIVKRKPKFKQDSSEEPSSTHALNKRRATEDEREDPAIAALHTQPTKGILRTAYHAPRKLSISFADAKNLPLVYIKEIERIAAIHSNVYDFRCSERNEGADLGTGFDDMEDVEWGLLAIKNVRRREWDMTEPAKREVQRLEDAGIMRGATFGNYTLRCIPELNDLAASDLAAYNPTNIPIISVPTEPAKVNALRDLPLPGRNRDSAQKSGYDQDHYHQRSPAAPKELPVIQQVFQETDSVMDNNYYTAATPKEESPPQTSGFELPANLKKMLEQLKKKGILSSEEPAPTQPESVDPMAAAMQAAQQMMTEPSASNTYSSEEYTGSDYEYVATFATPEIKAQERRQNSRNSEGWTQSGWKIQEPCVYFVNKPHGCNRGDNCRFVHDEELRQKTQAELPVRGYHRDGIRGDRRGRAGFRSSFHNNRHHSHHNNGLSHQEQYNGGRQEGLRASHFQNNDQGCIRGERYNSQRGCYAPRGSRFDKKDDLNVNLNRPPPNYNQPPPNYAQRPLSVQEPGNQQISNHYQRQEYDRSPNEISGQDVVAAQDSDPSPPKRQRTSRFDRVDDTPTDIDQRPQRKSRFDDRPHRSRFDQPSL